MVITPAVENRIAVTVNEIVDEADGVRSFVLTSSDGGTLPSWEPGAHIDIELPNGIVRQYSLCGDVGDRTRWRIAVLREPESRGGSEFFHDSLTVGAQLIAGGPRNHFPLVDAETYRFIAGGIGVTPILPMARHLDSIGRPWELLYGGRRLGSMAFIEELGKLNGKVTVSPEDAHGLLDLDSYLQDLSASTAVYCCGPEALLNAVEKHASGWQVGDLHIERFAPKEGALEGKSTSFEVEAVQSGVTVTVGPDESIADALDEAGVFVYTTCGEGTCGTCETVVLEGVPDHRDSMLTEAERAANNKMMVCCSRALSPRLKLDL